MNKPTNANLATDKLIQLRDSLPEMREESREEITSIIELIDDATGNQGGLFSIEVFLLILIFCLKYLLPQAEKLIKVWFDKKESRKTENWQEIMQLYDILNELKEEINCDRILLMYTSNGGGIPRPGTNVFATVLHGVGEEAAEEIKRWHKLPIDEAYVSVLYSLENKGSILLNCDDLSDGALKRTYKKRRIKYSIASKIHNDRKRYYYLTCNFKKSGVLGLGKKLSAAELDDKRDRIEMACKKLAKILN